MKCFARTGTSLFVFFVLLLVQGFAREKEIRGAKISKENDAKEIALNNFCQKIKKLYVSDSYVEMEILFLGYDVDSFARKGTKVWEAKVMRFDRSAIRAVLWIHPYTGKVRFVEGEWQSMELDFGSELAQRLFRKNEDNRLKGRSEFFNRLAKLEKELIEMSKMESKVINGEVIDVSYKRTITNSILRVNKNSPEALAISVLGQLRSIKAVNALIGGILLLDSEFNKANKKKQLSFISANSLIQIGNPAIPTLLDRLKEQIVDLEREIICWVIFKTVGREEALRIIIPIDSEEQELGKILKTVSKPDWEIKIEEGK